MRPFDLAVRNGLVVNASSRFHGDIGIREGRIDQLGGSIQAEQSIDAAGKLVLPGGIDMHVHLSPVQLPEETIRWVDDFQSGSAAAAAGGITTIGNITFPLPGETISAALQRTETEEAHNSLIDYVLHPVLLQPDCLNELPQLSDSGQRSIKIFMMLSSFDSATTEYLRIVEAAGKLEMVSMVHCEDASLIGFLCKRLLAEGRGSAAHYAESRPSYVETVAVQRAAAMAQATGAPLYIVHLSSARALAACRQARDEGARLWVEIRPIYLYLTRERFEEVDAAKYVGNPPLREPTDVEALWNGLRNGDIQTVCTDHAPWLLADKLEAGRDVSNFRPGISELETLLPMLYHGMVVTRKMPVERFVELTAANAARLFGLYPQKGTIAVGSDADLTIWDPEQKWRVRADAFHSRADFTPYEGWELVGKPIITISRGEVVCERGRISAAWGRGRRLKMAAAGRL